ncbi:MAG: hypothetical protein QW051_02865 [Candidatus Aenigmatarchaeota archaeon]
MVNYEILKVREYNKREHNKNKRIISEVRYYYNNSTGENSIWEYISIDGRPFIPYRKVVGEEAKELLKNRGKPLVIEFGKI